MNHLAIAIGLLAIGILSITLTTQTEAQLNVEGYTDEDKTKSFQRLQFIALIPASNVGDGDNFLNALETERAKHKIKAVPIPITVKLFCTHVTFGEIYALKGSYVFEEAAKSQLVKTWLKDNLPLDKIEYGEYYILENTHHWDNPQPDKILEHVTYGNQNAFNQILRDC